MNLCIHIASLEQYNTILSWNSIPPYLLTTILPLPNCHLIAFPPLWLCHLIVLSPFATCRLTPPTHLCHLVTSLKSYTFPTFPIYYCPTFPSSSPSQRQIDTSKIATFFHYLSRQGKHMWLIFMQPLRKAGWLDAPLCAPGFSWGDQQHGGFAISKIEKSFLPGNVHKSPKLESALLPSKPLKHVRCNSPWTWYTQHKIRVTKPYSQYPSLQPFTQVCPWISYPFTGIAPTAPFDLKR